MRLDPSQVLAQGGVLVRQSPDAAVDTLKDKGTAALLGYMEESDAENAAAEEESGEELLPGKQDAARGFADKNLAPFAAKLAQLNMAVTEDTARQMKDLMAKHPKLSMDEAAFLASNKITGDEELINAALEIISGKDKTSEMIAKLLSDLRGAAGGASVLKDAPGARGASVLRGTSDSSSAEVQRGASGAARAPLTEFIATVIKLAPALLESVNRAENKPADIPRQIISQPDSNLQSIPKNLDEVFGQPVKDGENAQETAAPPKTENAQETAAPPKGDEVPKSESVREQSANIPADNRALTDIILKLLSEIPEFKAMPQAELEKLAEIVVKIINDTGLAEGDITGERQVADKPVSGKPADEPVKSGEPAKDTNNASEKPVTEKPVNEQVKETTNPERNVDSEKETQMRVDASQVSGQGGINSKQGTNAPPADIIRDGAAQAAGINSGEDDLSLARPSLTKGFTDKTLEPFAGKLAELNMPVREDTARAMRDLMTQYPKLSMDEAAFLASNKITGDESMMRAALEVMSGGEKTSAMIAKIIASLSGSASGQNLLVNQDGLGTRNPDNIIEGTALPKTLEEGLRNFHISGGERAPLTQFIAAVVKLAPGILAAVNQQEAGNLQNMQPGAAQPGGTVLPGVANPQEGLQQPGTTAVQEGLQQQSAITAQDGLQQPGTTAVQDGMQQLTQNGAAPQIPGGGQGEGIQSIPGAPGEQNAQNIQNTQGFQSIQNAAGTAGNEQINILPGQQAAAGEGASTGQAVAAGVISGTTAAEQAQIPGEAPTANTGQAAETQQQRETAGGTVKDGAAQNTDIRAAQQAAGGQITDRAIAQSDNRPVAGAMAQLLSELPEFRGTPPAALDRFSNMLLRIAKDSGIEEGNGAAKNVETLVSQLDKMFTKIGRNDSDAGLRLREAREELFARLTLVQEEIARASQPMREQLLSQTQKLMDHVRLLNNIDQFAYMQLPVQLSEERKTADLYIFKRKGSKKVDPDNVNILLSIDLEHMGHWEALLNIKGKDVHLNMEVAGEAEKEHFSENTVLLHKLLDEEGFKLVNTIIKISQEETTPLNALSALERYTGAKQGRIDFMF